MADDILLKRNATLMRREKALSTFGTFAFHEQDLQLILNEAARSCAECLEAPYSKICQFRPGQNDLLVVAGHGWKSGVVGFAISVADESSPQGRAFTTGQPQFCRNIDSANTYSLPSFYSDHGILSTVDVLVATNGGLPFGVLEVDSTATDTFDQHDIDFLTGFANILAEAVATSGRAAELRRTIMRMQTLIEEKETLSQELKHRVRNSLHLVYGLLASEIDGEYDKASIAAFRSIALRVMGLAQVFDHLLGIGMNRVINFGAYVMALCKNLPELYQENNITLSATTDAVEVELDKATSLGIVITELINNSYLHAFGKSGGQINVTLRVGADEALLQIADNGVGFIEVETGRRGMTLVKRLVKQIGGTISVQSDHGSKWMVRFPVCPASTVAVGLGG
jgi:two-component sensor histidine kinase